jgi:hypothetical protein
MKIIPVDGLRDGQFTGATAHLTRQIKALGASVEVASTGRVTVTTASGERLVYVLERPIRKLTRAQLEALPAEVQRHSPLTQALADLRHAR